MRLVADIGGTNTRLGLSANGRVLRGSILSYENAPWPDFRAVLDQFLEPEHTRDITEMVIACAAPANGRRGELTNLDWVVEGEALARDLGIARFGVINDLAALGHSVPVLEERHLTIIARGRATKADFATSLVVGVGTGFNVSPVFQMNGRSLCPPAEIGHLSLASSLSEKLRAEGLDPQAFQTTEHLFSGRGFAKFCQQITGNPALDGHAAMAAYKSMENPDIVRAVSTYSDLLGRQLSEFCLSYMPRSGLYLAGSVARALMSTVSAPCLKVLRADKRVPLMAEIPVWTIDDDSAALMGCARYDQLYTVSKASI